MATLGYAHTSAAIEIADLSVTKTAAVNEVIGGEELFYDIHVHNYGPTTATAAEMTDELPEGLTFLADTAPGGCALATTTLTCALGNIPDGGNVDFQIKVLVAADFVSAKECLSGTNAGKRCDSVSDCPGALPSPPNPPQCAADADGTRTLINTAKVAGVNDPDTSDNSSTEHTFVTEEADLRITKFVEPTGTVDPGEIFIYTIYVDNLGPSDARNVLIRDTLLNSNLVTVQSCAFSVSQGGGAITQFTCDTGDLVQTQFGTDIGLFRTNDLVPFDVNPSDPTMPFGRLRASFRLIANDGADLTNISWVSADTNDPDASNNVATVDIEVTPPLADLAITKFVEPTTTIRAGDLFWYTIWVDNLGPSIARNVVIRDTLLSSNNVSIQSCSFSVSQGGGSLTQFSCTTGELVQTQFGTDIGTFATDILAPWGDNPDPMDPNNHPYGRMRASFRLLAKDGADVTNTTRVYSDTNDPDESNNFATVDITVTPLSDLAITKTGSPNPVVAGDLLTYTITVTNNGPSTATNVVVKDDLPSQVTVVSVTSTGNACINGVPGDIQQPLTCYMGNLAGPAGNPTVITSEQITVVVRVKSGTPDGSTLYNQVRVSSDTEDPNNVNNIDTENTTVVTKLDLPTTNFVSVSKKGSLLYYSKIELRFAPNGSLRQDTFLTIVNDYPSDVFVQWYFINGDAPLDAVFAGNPQILVERAHTGWNWVDCTTHLSHDESIYLSAAKGGPLGCSPFTDLDPGTPPGRPDPDGPTGERVLRGYAIAFAVDNQDHEISWNHLSGSVDIVDYSNRSAWEYNGYAFQCAYTSTVGNPCGTDPGILHLDGVEYDSAFERLLFDFYAVGSQAYTQGLNSVSLDTDLTLFPVDVDLRQDNNGPVTTKAKFDIWNENEDRQSTTTRCITGWDQTLLSNYGSPNRFLIGSLQTNKGKARIEGVQSSVCDPPGSCCNLATDLDCFPSVNHPQIDSDCSVKAALLGVSDKIFAFSGAVSGRTDAGMTLVGHGTQSATIKRDIIRPFGLLTTDPIGSAVSVQVGTETSISSPRQMSREQSPDKE